MASNISLEPTFQATWGVFAVLIWVSIASNGQCITMQAYTYFHKFFHRDHYILKYAVAYIWFSCVTLALCEFWAIHNIIVAGYYLPSELVIISPGFPIGLAIGMTIGCTMKGIYIFRMYRFNHNRYLLVCCCILVGLELGTGFTWVARVAHAVFAWQEAVLNEKSKWIITTFFTTSMVLDMFIAASTCYQLWRSRMIGFKRCDAALGGYVDPVDDP
ncbi:hypothetical protein BD779DRAFT_1800147 [Infundibulicybe gibba]|nr:hypothetical protein BD779DRAFT_1800147 [Infundibulicybe gibba]